MFLNRTTQMFIRSGRLAVRLSGARANTTIKPLINPNFSRIPLKLCIIAETSWPQERWAVSELNASSDDVSDNFVWWMANGDPCALAVENADTAHANDSFDDIAVDDQGQDECDWPLQWWMANTDPYAFQGTPKEF